MPQKKLRLTLRVEAESLYLLPTFPSLGPFSLLSPLSLEATSFRASCPILSPCSRVNSRSSSCLPVRQIGPNVYLAYYSASQLRAHAGATPVNTDDLSAARRPASVAQELVLLIPFEIEAIFKREKSLFLASFLGTDAALFV